MAKSITINILDNGPLQITGDSLSIQFCGEPLPVEADAGVFLCRCGESANAPFCDGSHAKTGFVAEPSTSAGKDVKVWEGKTIRTFFNPNICMHAFYCKPLGALRERELEGDRDAAEEIARVVQSCPSGALHYEASDVLEPPTAERAEIEIIEGGEVRVQCGFEINTELQERQTADRVTLCRCGLSENKPWCDGRHKKRKDFR